MYIDKIKDYDELVNLHTGLPTYNHLLYVYEIVEDAAGNMLYWAGSSKSSFVKSYQRYDHKRPGPARKLPMKDQLLLTLMKLRMNVSEPHLAYFFVFPNQLCPKLLQHGYLCSM